MPENSSKRSGSSQGRDDNIQKEPHQQIKDNLFQKASDGKLRWKGAQGINRTDSQEWARESAVIDFILGR